MVFMGSSSNFGFGKTLLERDLRYPCDVIAGLDPAIHLRAKEMDPRVTGIERVDFIETHS
jgi:hypothetical protein